MLYNYVAIVFFIAFAIFLPLSLLLTSRILRSDKPGNKVKNSPYESAEETIGRVKDTDIEYMPFFAIFLPFEIVAMVLILWSVSARSLSFTTNLMVIGLAIVAMVMSLIGYLYIREKHA
jgi:NADH:ubiquinone oxidoreductase subunit 3 (subunit A)